MENQFQYDFLTVLEVLGIRNVTVLLLSFKVINCTILINAFQYGANR